MKKQVFDEHDYKLLKAIARETNTTIVQKKTAEGILYNGVTIAYRQKYSGPDAVMLQVAVSYCSSEDKFKKKVGKYTALYKLEASEYVQLPLAHRLYYNGPEDVNAYLLSIFGNIIT